MGIKFTFIFTKKGRIECTNYRTQSLPTGNKVPLFVNQGDRVKIDTRTGEYVERVK